jgi:hypothetical protein
MVLPAHALEVLQVRWKSVSNKGHFAVEDEGFFCPCLPQDGKGVTE